MGGFANLKKDFDMYRDVLEGKRNPENRSEVLDYLKLRCLFEIAGNLDTIAVEVRKQTAIMQVNSDRAAEQSKVLIEAADKIINPVVFSSGLPAATGFGDPRKK